MERELVYLVPQDARNEAGIRHFLAEHPEVRFVSLVAVDLGGNDTDEKIPVSAFLRDISGFLGGAIQTDGSSVVMPGIASLNDAKVDFVTDPTVAWYIDYNWDHIDPGTGMPIGTLRIPSFLEHGGKKVDSRSVLSRAVEVLIRRVRELIESWPELAADLGFDPDDLVEIIPTAATELEFWVRTPGRDVGPDELALSQALHEQYWKRTKGPVRTALEAAMILLEKYGLAPEMGHKEVGGVKARVAGEGRLDDIMEQLEIDWRYSTPIQAADNELLARVTIKEVFRRYGLEVTFLAKPIAGVAGSGEHVHVGLAARLRDGRTINLFAPARPDREYLSPLGWGALFGLLKHWPALGALVTATNDAFNRLQPGFEAPVCPVAAIGTSVRNVTRNRTVLIGLVRDPNRPAATRFEIRAPHPHTNTYLALAGFFQAMLDGMAHVTADRRTEESLLAEFSKAAGEEGTYLPAEHAFRCEEDVFAAFDEQERRRLFGVSPATVWEAMQHLAAGSPGRTLLARDGVFPPEVLESYALAMLAQWRLELTERLLPQGLAQIRRCLPRHDAGDEHAAAAWEKVERLRREIIAAGYFERIVEALRSGDDRTASDLQCRMMPALNALQKEYQHYRRWYGD